MALTEYCLYIFAICMVVFACGTSTYLITSNTEWTDAQCFVLNSTWMEDIYCIDYGNSTFHCLHDELKNPTAALELKAFLKSRIPLVTRIVKQSGFLYNVAVIYGDAVWNGKIRHPHARQQETPTSDEPLVPIYSTNQVYRCVLMIEKLKLGDKMVPIPDNNITGTLLGIADDDGNSSGTASSSKVNDYFLNSIMFDVAIVWPETDVFLESHKLENLMRKVLVGVSIIGCIVVIILIHLYRTISKTLNDNKSISSDGTTTSTVFVTGGGGDGASDEHNYI